MVEHVCKNFNFLCLKVPEILMALCFEPVRYVYKRGRGTFDLDRQFPLLPLRVLDTLCVCAYCPNRRPTHPSICYWEPYNI